MLLIMQTYLVDYLSRRITIAAINGYQKHISPHKGFACAHRVLYGSESCSQYIKKAIAKEGLRVRWLRFRDRFQACKQAHKILRSQSQRVKLPVSQQNRRRHYNDCLDVGCAEIGCGCAEGLFEFGDCGVADCSFFICSGINWR
ncbi:FIG00872897: hypothetical protein [Richelia intracellularis]|nr:FIG00872897: hypothetical protein [Richelia intracellularis]